MIPSECPGTQ